MQTLSGTTVLNTVDMSLRGPARGGAPLDQWPLQEQLDALERDMLIAALEQSDWIQTRAADRLGISERVLRYKMGKYGIRRGWERGEPR